MNRYRITLFPVRGKTEDINIEETQETVVNVAEAYNQYAKRAANKKWIEISSIGVEKDNINFVLASECWLQFPTKAIKGFIARLCEHEVYRSLLTPNGRLFQGDSEFIEDEMVSEEELSDEETLIEVIKLFFRETKDNREKITAIKQALRTACDTCQSN